MSSNENGYAWGLIGLSPHAYELVGVQTITKY